MILRHWTAAQRVEQILQQGIYPTDPNLSERGPVEPLVVWLLPPDVDPGTGAEHGLHDRKRDGWVDVDVPAIRWVDWEPQHRMTASWRDAITAGGGGPERAAQWYVFPAHIRPSRIVGHGTVSRETPNREDSQS